MDKNKTQLLRLVFIDRKIRQGMQSGRLANCSSMAAEYEVSTKSILRDIDFLKNQMDAPIAYDAARRGYFYTEEHYALPAIDLSESDLFAIQIAQQVLKQHERTPIYKKLAAVFAKIERSLPEKVSVHPSWADSRFSVILDRGTKIDSAVWEALAEALHRNRTMKIVYRKPGAAKGAARLVDPYHAVSYQGEWYMIAHCHRRSEVLTFAVSRIAEAALSEESFSVPATFSFEQFIGKRFGIFGGDTEHRVRIWFSAAHAPYVLEREWHPSQRIERGEAGGIILSLTVSHLYELKRWVLAWGGGVQVLAPQELVDDIKEDIAAMQTFYTAQGGDDRPASGIP